MIRSTPSKPSIPLPSRGALVGALLAFAACEDGGAAPDPATAQYLVANGTWVLDDSEQSFSDPRNPRRMVLETTEAPGSPSTFSFYADVAGAIPIAEGCIYQYNRSQPDSYRFPERKEAVWVMFDLAPDSPAACQPYARVGFAPTLDTAAAGDTATRLHLRFGTMDYAELVGPTFSDPSSPDLWWAVFRAVRGTRDAPTFPYAVANGERVIDPTSTTSVEDPRNPSRVTLSTPSTPGSESRFVFYANGKPDEIWADCNFQVRYTMPDPSSFPANKTALWDAFEMTSANAGACEAFARVVMFWPDGGPDMHLRYGEVGFEDLLLQSLEPDDAWWARYCEPDGETCTRP